MTREKDTLTQSDQCSLFPLAYKTSIGYVLWPWNVLETEVQP